MINLPAEVIQQVLWHLSREDIKNCYLVSKNWQSIFIQYYWEEVMLYSSKNYFVKKLLKEPDYKEYFKYGHLVRKLSFNGNCMYDPANALTREELISLLKQLPNIREIGASYRCRYFRSYFEYLNDVELPYLEVLPDYPGNNDNIDYKLYSTVCYKFRTTLLSMYIFYGGANYPLYQDMNITIFFSHFKSLTNIIFHNFTNSDLITPFKIQQYCPNLNCLIFDNSNYLKSSNYLMEIFLKSKDREKLNLVSSSLKLLIYLPFLSLRTYIIDYKDYLPRHLNYLNIQISHETVFNWIDNVGMENAIAFMTKISEIKDIGITFNERFPYEGDIDRKLLAISNLFKLLAAYKEIRKTDCFLKFLDIKNYPSKCSITRTPEDNIYIEYSLNASFNHIHKLLTLPDRKISTIGLEAIDILHILRRHGNVNISRNIPIFFLKNCCNLKEFDYMQSSSIISETDPLVIRCRYDKERKSLTLKTRFLNILEDYALSYKRFFNAFDTTYLFNIEDLVIDSDRWLEEIMDLTGFKNLKTFTFITYEKENNNIKKVIRNVVANVDDSFYVVSFTNEVTYLHNNRSPIVTFLHEKVVNFKLRINGRDVDLIS